MCMTLFRHWAEERRGKFVSGLFTDVKKEAPVVCRGFKTQEIVPFLLHEIVTLCVKSFEELGDECVAVAYAVAEFPFLEDDMDLIDQVVAGAVALGEQLMQREVVPSQVNVAVIETLHNTVPEELRI